MVCACEEGRRKDMGEEEVGREMKFGFWNLRTFSQSVA
jgi:hypothetical protein